MTLPRRQTLPYVTIWVLYYAWVIVFSTWWTAAPDTGLPFDTGTRSLIHSFELVSSALFVLIMRRTWFVRMARTGAMGIIVCLLLYLAIQGGLPTSAQSVKVAIAILLAVFVGCVNSAILMPFVFTMNDGERLISVVGSNILIYVLLLLQQTVPLGADAQTASSIALLLGSLLAIPFFKVADVPPDNRCVHALSRDADAEQASATTRPGADAKCTSSISRQDIDMERMGVSTGRAYLALILSCLFAIMGKGVTRGILNAITAAQTTSATTAGAPATSTVAAAATAATTAAALSPALAYIVASIAGAALFYALYRLPEKVSDLSWNIVYGFIAMSFALYAFSDGSQAMPSAFAIFAGLGNTMGMCNMYYLLGYHGSRRDGMRYVRLSIILIGICGGVSGVVIGNIIAGQRFPDIPLIAAMISSIAVLALLTISPYLVRSRDGQTRHDPCDVITNPAEKTTSGSGANAKAAREKGLGSNPESSPGDEPGADSGTDPFRRYALSRREAEVCRLLLGGYTMNQIASMLCLAYPTVNTYCTTLYRKTGVNSRAELMLLFKDHL